MSAGVTVFPTTGPGHPPPVGLWWAVRFEGQAFRDPETRALMKFPTEVESRDFAVANIRDLIEGGKLNPDRLTDGVRAMLANRPRPAWMTAREPALNVIDLRPGDDS